MLKICNHKVDSSFLEQIICQDFGISQKLTLISDATLHILCNIMYFYFTYASTLYED